MHKIKQPIFVFGCCNSGTTILWQTLLQHKDVCGPIIESQDLEGLPDVMMHYLGKDTFRLWAHPRFNLAYYVTGDDLTVEDREKILKVYGQYLKPGKRFIAKSPADTLRARLIQTIFPDAKFVAIVRNGYAVAEGIVRKRKYDPDRPQFKGLTTTIEEAAEQWFRTNVVVISHQKFLKNYLIIRYEDLVEQPYEVLQSILEFCQLDTHKIRAPRFKKNKNQKQIVRLTDEEVQIITKIAKPMLTHFGYHLQRRMYLK